MDCFGLEALNKKDSSGWELCKGRRKILGEEDKKGDSLYCQGGRQWGTEILGWQECSNTNELFGQPNRKGNVKKRHEEIFDRTSLEWVEKGKASMSLLMSYSTLVEKVLVAQLCSTLCNPMDCSPPGSSVHGFLQARILEWVAIPFSKGSSWPRDRTQVSCIAGRLLTVWAPREAQST